MVYLNDVTSISLITLFLMKFQMSKCLVEISHKLVPSGNLQSTGGSSKVYIISHGLDKHQIEDILKNDEVKSLINESQQVKKIHLNSSTNVDHLYDIIDHSHEEQEILQKLSSRLGLDVMGYENILRDSSSSNPTYSSIQNSSSELTRTGTTDKNVFNNENEVNSFSNASNFFNNDPNYGHLTKSILRMGASSGCSKGASKSCNKACKKALSNVCHEYKCSNELISRFEMECGHRCNKKFGNN